MQTINAGYVTIVQAAKMIGTSAHTIRRWYKWWENENFEHHKGLYLPPYYILDRRGTKWFKEEDVYHLKEFRRRLNLTHRGEMNTFNAAYQWSKKQRKKFLNSKGYSDIEIQELRTDIKGF